MSMDFRRRQQQKKWKKNKQNYWALFCFSFIVIYSIRFKSKTDKKIRIKSLTQTSEHNRIATRLKLFCLRFYLEARALNHSLFCSSILRARSTPHKRWWLRREHTATTQQQQQTARQISAFGGCAEAGSRSSIRVCFGDLWMCSSCK